MSLNRLQRAQDIAARVVMDAHRHTDAKPLLRQLHWLPVRQRILFKMAVLTRKAHTTGTPTYPHISSFGVSKSGKNVEGSRRKLFFWGGGTWLTQVYLEHGSSFSAVTQLVRYCDTVGWVV